MASSDAALSTSIVNSGKRQTGSQSRIETGCVQSGEMVFAGKEL